MRLAAALASAIVALLFAHAAEAPEAQAQIIQLAAPPPLPPPPQLHPHILRLARGDTLQTALSEAGVAARDVARVLAARR